MQRIKKDYDAVLVRYGSDFRQNYAWARPALLRQNQNRKGDKIGFDHLQAAVNVEHWTPDYRMASHAVHPSATFIQFNLGSRQDVPVMLGKAGTLGVAYPGAHGVACRAPSSTRSSSSRFTSTRRLVVFILAP
jgi:hypothetical protein